MERASSHPGPCAGAAELAARIARGELSAVDAVRAQVARIEAVNGRQAEDRRAALVEARERHRARFLGALDAARVDAIVCPPHALPALRHGASELLSSAASYAMVFNLVGLPAGVVAATRVRPGEESDRRPGRDLVERAAARVEAGSAGLPVGVQVAARPWREDVVLAVMGALEAHFRGRPDYPAAPPP